MTPGLQTTGGGVRAALAVAVLCAGLSAASTAGAAAAPAADPLREALTDWQAGLRQVSSIASDFVQEKRLALFQDVLTIRGCLFIATNGLFAWETHWPVRYKLVVADGRIRQWDEETGRVQTFSMRDNPAASVIHAQMSAWFSGQYEGLTNTYDVALAAEHPVSFLFTPRAGSPAAGYVATVQVWLRPDGHYLDKVRIAELSGDSTAITFTNTVLNQDLPATAWDVQVLATNALPATAAGAPVGE